MGVRSSGRKLSFEILSSYTSFEDDDGDGDDHNHSIYRSNSGEIWSSEPKQKRKRRNKAKKKKNTENSISEEVSVASEVIDSEICDPRHTSVYENGSCVSEELELNLKNYSVLSVLCEEVTVPVPEEEEKSVGIVRTLGPAATESGFQKLHGGEGYSIRALRQRNVNGSSSSIASACGVEEEAATDIFESSAEKQRDKPNGNAVSTLETEKSLDWKQLMAKDPNYRFSVDKSPVRYFIENMSAGNALKSTTTLGNEKERERVYDTIFRLPWRCELLINVGFFVCFDSFLSLLSIMPTRILVALLKLLKTRQFKKPSAAELSDFGCFLVLASGIILLEQADISLIYHMIRGQGTIKLYVVYNVLEIFDRLCQSFGGDVLQALFSSAERLASCSPESTNYWLWRYISDGVLAMAASNVHSFVLLAQAITLSTCIVAHNNALLALLVSNNFAEIKGNVFKRFSKDNIRSLVYADSVERFHIMAFLLFVLAQNILEAEGPWFEGFLFNALLVYTCEMMIDIIKHSFLAKFNEVKPIAYSEFLEDLCKQTLNIETENEKKNLTFVPLAPACVVIRVITPVYAAHLPYSPLPWRVFWIVFQFGLSFVMIASLKVMIGMGLQKHANWYVNRCQSRKLHTD